MVPVHLSHDINSPSHCEKTELTKIAKRTIMRCRRVSPHSKSQNAMFVLFCCFVAVAFGQCGNGQVDAGEDCDGKIFVPLIVLLRPWVLLMAWSTVC